jgi:uncharacterized protein (DUF58 family)
VYTEERDRPVVLIVDQRLSMFFGSRKKMKSVMAAELAALSAWRVLDQGDRVGGIFFNDHCISQVKPSRSKGKLMSMLGDLSSLNQALKADSEDQPQASQLSAALDAAERMAGHDYLLVIISDFEGWNEGCLASVKRLARHNDLIAALVYDPLEQDISQASNLVVSDGRYQLQLNPQKAELGQRFEASFHSGVRDLQAELRKHGMPVLTINTVDPVFEQLREQLGQH